MSEPTISLKEVKNGSQASNDRLTTLSKSWYLQASNFSLSCRHKSRQSLVVLLLFYYLFHFLLLLFLLSLGTPNKLLLFLNNADH